MAKYKINQFKIFYLTGKKEVGSAISNINDEAVINSDVNDDSQVGEQLESSSSQPYSNKYYKNILVLIRIHYSKVHLVKLVWYDNEIKRKSNWESLEQNIQKDKLEPAISEKY